MVHHRKMVAVQVKDVVGIAGPLHQPQAKLVDLGLGLLRGKGCSKGLPDRRHIRSGVRAKLTLQRVAGQSRQIGIPPVEVVRPFQIAPPDRFVQQPFRQADGIGQGNDDDMAGDAAFGFGLIQKVHQVIKRQRTGHFIGMKATLQIDLGPCTGPAPMMPGQASRGSRTWPRQVNILGLHLHLWSD